MSIEATEISAYTAPPARKAEAEKPDESFDQHLADAIDESAPAKEDQAPIRDTASAETANPSETGAPARESDDAANDAEPAAPETAASTTDQAPNTVDRASADTGQAPVEAPIPGAPVVPTSTAGTEKMASANIATPATDAATTSATDAANGAQTQQPVAQTTSSTVPVEAPAPTSTATPALADMAVAATVTASQAAQNTTAQAAPQSNKSKPNTAAATPTVQSTDSQTTLVSQVGKEVSQLLGDDDAAAVPPADPDAAETALSNAAAARTSRTAASGTATGNTATAAATNANAAAIPTDRPTVGGEPANPAQTVPTTTGNAGQPANPAALPPVDMPADAMAMSPVGGNSQPAPVQPSAIQTAAVSQQAAAHQPAAQQVAVHIAKAAEDGTDRIRIQLNPAELGRVDVRLEVGHDGRVQAVVMADRPETLDMLRRDIAGLEKALADAGLKADSGGLSFSLRGDDDRGGFAEGDDGYGATPDGLDDDIPGPEVIAEGGRLIAADGALDIRV